MKRSVFVWLLIVATLALGSMPRAAAQDDGLRAVTLSDIAVYTAPSASSELVVELTDNMLVRVLSSDPSGNWLRIEAAGEEGYVEAAQVLILTPALLAPVVTLTPGSASATLYAAPSTSSKQVGAIPPGGTARVLGQREDWAYVAAPDGLTGWVTATAQEPAASLQAALVQPGADGAPSLLSAPDAAAEVAGALEDGQLVHLTGRTQGVFGEVITAEGASGWVESNLLRPLPNAYVNAVAGAEASPSLYAGPSFAADLLATLADGTTLTYLGRPNDFWIEVYSPAVGRAYGIARSFGPVHTTATVQVSGANVRQGPDADRYDAIASLEAGTEVVVLGTNEARDWVKVLVPFSEIDFPYRGVEGWMAAFLFGTAEDGSSLDLNALSIIETEGEAAAN